MRGSAPICRAAGPIGTRPNQSTASGQKRCFHLLGQEDRVSHVWMWALLTPEMMGHVARLFAARTFIGGKQPPPILMYVNPTLAPPLPGCMVFNHVGYVVDKDGVFFQSHPQLR